MYVAEGFCAVDYSNDFMQVTRCMITYIHYCNVLSLHEPNVFESDIDLKVLAIGFELWYVSASIVL